MEINLRVGRSVLNSVKDGERQTNKSHLSIIRARICLLARSARLYRNLNNGFSQLGVLRGGQLRASLLEGFFF